MRLYNPSRGPVSVSLLDGGVLTVPPKSYVEVVGRDASSAELKRAVKTGKLIVVRSEPVEPSPASVPAQVIASKAIALVAAVDEAVDVDVDSESEHKRERKSRK